MEKSILEQEIKNIFSEKLGLFFESKEQEVTPLFYYNSKFTPAMGAYLFIIIYHKYNIDLSEIYSTFQKEMSFESIVDYVYSHISSKY